MGLELPNSRGTSKPAIHGVNSFSKMDNKNEETDKKTAEISKQKLTQEELEIIRLDDREYLIEDIMKDKGVSREVAEAEVDSF
jgi:predicted DNA-binding protein (UPF0251 family)